MGAPPLVNTDIGAVFDEIADLLELQDANMFRIRAYRNAARVLSECRKNVRSMVERGEDPDALPGIGPDLAKKIAEIVATGTCAMLEKLHAEVPPGATQLLHVPGLGPKRVMRLRATLGIQSLQDLKQAAQQNRIQTVPGFSAEGEQRLLKAVTARLSQPPRVKLSIGAQLAETLLNELKTVAGVHQAVVAGSLRRCRDTVGDLDLLIAATRSAPVMQHFITGREVRTVLSKGTTRASVLLSNGMQVDLRAVPRQSFGAAWLYFTGSKAHNIALRKLAQDAGLKLNEYGLYRSAMRIAGDTEASVYTALGLPWIEPELREDRGELEAARTGQLPHLVKRSELRGDLHTHTTESDGHDGLEAMAVAAKASGLQYIAVTEHSKHLAVAHGLGVSRLARQIDRIDALNQTLQGLTLLKGVEVDILDDGRLDLPNSILKRLDLVVGAVHHRFDLSREQQTDRLLRAMDNPFFSILAHPTGRLLGERLPYAIDMQKIILHARQRGCFLELNAHPSRLDLDDVACRMAKDAGVLISIATDAHSTLDFSNLDFGVGQARRGWLEATDVLNTRSLPKLRALLAATMGRGSSGTGLRRKSETLSVF